MDNLYDIIIIGSGPAGMSAAVYGSRAGMKTLLIEFDAPGGKMVKTLEVQNWPGIIEVMGPTLAYDMYKHALAYGATFDAAEIHAVDKTKEGQFILTAADGRTFKGKSVIVATGTQERKFDNIMNNQKFDGRGISYCAICDGGFYRDKIVAVMGGGNSALDEAVYLTKFAKKVFLVHRRDEFRGDQITVKRAQENEKIEFVLNAQLAEIIDKDGAFGGIIVEQNGQMRQLDIDGMFVYIGSTPRSQMVQHFGITDEHGYIVTNTKMETKIPGLYAAGDIRQKELRQIVTATGDGAIAGQEASVYIECLEG